MQALKIIVRMLWSVPHIEKFLVMQQSVLLATNVFIIGFGKNKSKAANL